MLYGHHPQPGELRAQQAGQGQDLGEGDQHLGLGGAQDAGLAAEVVLDLALAGRRIEGDRDAAGELRAEEGGEVFEARGEHDSHRLARRNAEAD